MMAFEGNELTSLLFKAFEIIFLSGIISLPFVPLRLKPLVSILIVSLIVLVTSTLAITGLSGDGFEYVIDGGFFFGEIPFRVDPLSAWFILIINLTAFTGVIYGAGYLESNSANTTMISLHWVLYIIFHSSMVLVTMVQHSMAFLVAWELMSLSSFLLVIFDYSNHKVIKAGINYLVQMHLSVILLTVGFIWVFVRTGTFDFKGIGVFFGSNVNLWLFLIFFAGFGLKAGFIGLHTWLPHAHPAAPSHISGVMSGVIVKLGIYGILRMITFLRADFLVIGYIIITLSILTGLFGIMNAAVHRDFKKLLAYCTIENIGIIGVGTGIGLIGLGNGQGMLVFFGFGGALLHVLNHSLFKSLLFYSAGAVYSQTHTRDMDKLGGLIRRMPKTAFLFLIGSIAIGGIPPLNGFVSEFLIYSGILNGISSGGISQVTLMILTFAAMSLIGGISILTFTKTFGTIFLGSPRQSFTHEPHEVSPLMLMPQYIILFFMVFIAFFPVTMINLTGRILESSAFSVSRFEISGLQSYLPVMKTMSLVSVAFVALTGFILLLRRVISKGNEEKYAPTWGCGYVAPNSRMQYTGKSYSKSFGKLLNFVMIEKKGYSEIERNEIFPGTRKYRSFYIDSIESKIIDPVLFLIRRFINLFQFVQNGRIQAYVIYGIVFIVVILIGTILIF